MCGFAGGIIKAAAISADETIKQLRKIIKELQITMFVTGAQNIKALKNTEIQKR
jgi:isopentenyl diphosphate isomerase/L-lactate dehydrogenase-like FMN-dependent dehydrogenase